MNHQKRKEYHVYYPSEFPRLCDKYDQQREHIYHEARYEELKESYRADAVNICRFGMSLHQHAEEMHHQMIARWNKVVSQTDEVYILGDFAWKNAIGDEVLSQLCGRKFRDSRKNNSYSLLSADYFCDCISY